LIEHNNPYITGIGDEKASLGIVAHMERLRELALSDCEPKLAILVESLDTMVVPIGHINQTLKDGDVHGGIELILIGAMTSPNKFKFRRSFIERSSRRIIGYA